MQHNPLGCVAHTATTSHLTSTHATCYITTALVGVHVTTSSLAGWQSFTVASSALHNSHHGPQPMHPKCYLSAAIFTPMHLEVLSLITHLTPMHLEVTPHSSHTKCTSLTPQLSLGIHSVKVIGSSAHYFASQAVSFVISSITCQHVVL